MTNQRIEKIYSKLKAEVILEKDPNKQLIKAEQLIFYCWKNYPLRFSDADLDSILEKQMIVSENLNQKKNNHFVYVASTLFAIGGHTRCILNFIDNLPNYQHTIILTRQIKTIPTNVANFLKNKNVGIHILETNCLTLDKSLKLKSEVDTINPSKVFLFQHPDDLVPLMAFGKNKTHEVVQYNHADHVFSVGTNYFSRLMDFRNTGALISHFGKSSTKHQIQVLPIQNQYENINRSDSKQKLEIDSNKRIVGILTNFDKAKSFNGMPNLVDILLEISTKYADFIYVIIGLNEQEFIAINGQSNPIPKNIQCVGIVENPEPFYETFDFFLEPFPIGSGLGILEACKHGAIPIFAPQQARLCSTFDVFHVEIQKYLKEATTFDNYYSTIDNYFTLNSDEINEFSDKIRLGIYQYHRGETWAAQLENTEMKFEPSNKIDGELFLKNEAMFFQLYQKKSNNELIEHLLSLKQLITKKLLLSFFIGSNRLFSIFDLNKQNAKRLANKFLKS